MTKAKGFRVRLTGDGLNLNQSVSAEVAQSIVALVLGGSVPAATGAGNATRESGPGGEPGGGGQRSIREFLIECQPKRAPDQIATIALFFKSFKMLSKFTKSQLIEGFEEALEPVPKNLPRDIQWAARIGWIAPKSGEKGTYYLTSSGEEAV